MEDTIKLSEIKKIRVQRGEVLAILEKALGGSKNYDVADFISKELNCRVIIVEDFDHFKVITTDKISNEK